MKQIIKLAELNWTLTLANRAEISARATKDEDAIESAKSKVVIAQENLDKQLNCKRMESALNKYEGREDEVAEALKEAGFDTAVMDFFG
jgi:hypothetical protein